MLIRVQYLNEKFDYTDRSTLHRLIESGRLKKFLRPSSKDWVTIGVDPVRGQGGGAYQGPERRNEDE
jgi:hypothetical protein